MRSYDELLAAHLLEGHLGFFQESAPSGFTTPRPATRQLDLGMEAFSSGLVSDVGEFGKQVCQSDHCLGNHPR